MNKLMSKIVEILDKECRHYTVKFLEEYPVIEIKIHDKPEKMESLVEIFDTLDEYNGGDSLCPEFHKKEKIISLDPSTMYLEDLDGDKYYIEK